MSILEYRIYIYILGVINPDLSGKAGPVSSVYCSFFLLVVIVILEQGLSTFPMLRLFNAIFMCGDPQP